MAHPHLCWRSSVVACVSAVAVSGMLSPVGHQAAWATNDGRGPKVLDVRVSQTSVSAYGLSTTNVIVAVDLIDVDGVVTGPPPDVPYGGYWAPYVTFTRIAGRPKGGPAGPGAIVEGMQLVSGTAKHGTWAVQWPIPSTFDGTWQATEVYAFDVNGNETTVDPRAAGIDRRITVTGSHQPLLKQSFAPDPFRRGDDHLVQYVSVVDTDTGKGMSPVGVGLATDNRCGGDQISGTTQYTDTAGRTSAELGSWSPLLVCSTLTLPGGNSLPDQNNDQLAAYNGLHPRVQTLFLHVGAASTTVQHGHNVDVTGSIWPGGIGGRVLLQREINGSWRTVNTAPLGNGSRFTVVATPPSAGTHHYRVVKPSDSCSAGRCEIVGTVSRVITITAT